jgi:hypothetical protein
MADPFTIQIFVPDGDPEGVRLIDRMNWTGQTCCTTRLPGADSRPLSPYFLRSQWLHKPAKTTVVDKTATVAATRDLQEDTP